MWGWIKDKSGQTYMGIHASTILPGSHNIFAFWTDPADLMVKLVYVNPKDSNAVIMGEPLGRGKFTGATFASTTAVISEAPVAEIDSGIEIDDGIAEGANVEPELVSDISTGANGIQFIL